MADDPSTVLKKSDVAKSEATLSTVAAVGALLTMYFDKSPGVMKWLSPAITVMMAMVYALFRTPLVANHSGWRTKTFWVSVVTVVGSGAAAINESDIAGIPAGVVKVCGVIVAACTAMGYTLWRYKKKVGDSQ